jgi:hypothetical protein
MTTRIREKNNEEQDSALKKECTKIAKTVTK